MSRVRQDGSGRGGSGGCLHPAGAGFFRCDGNGTEMATQGGQGSQGWHLREQHAHGGEKDAAATASSRQVRGGGGWGLAGGVDVDAGAAVGADVPMHDETVHTGMAQAVMGHDLPQMQSQDECQPSRQGKLPCRAQGHKPTALVTSGTALVGQVYLRQVVC
jgi:hypothetical protein